MLLISIYFIFYPFYFFLISSIGILLIEDLASSFFRFSFYGVNPDLMT